MRRSPGAVLRRRALGAAVVVAAALALTPSAPGPASAAVPPSSPLTVEGTGAFADLAVTVSQTRDLVNQSVEISWNGAAPTSPNGFFVNYLQVMQCWGDAATGPTREQCQFGGRAGVETRGTSGTTSRNVNNGRSLVDPAETIRPPAGNPGGPAPVPFASVTGVTAPSAPNELYDASTTNEIVYGLTRADGTGAESFEVQTAVEAPGLGCGAVSAATPEGRGCWLVVVPRDDREVDGSVRGTNGVSGLQSSPLSQSNWDRRLVFPLGFVKIEDPCASGVQQQVLGQEQLVEAVTRWQPVLCDDTSSYSYTQLADPLVRQSVLGPQPGLGVTSRPVPAADVPSDRRLVYAPLAVSGIAVAVLLERAPLPGAPAAVQARAGSRVRDLRLTPRLLAKLLTQSYTDAVPNGDPSVEGNPRFLHRDPEFLALNPEFEDLTYGSLSDVLVPLGQSDAAALVWDYVLGDPEARAWLDGAPDADGMVVNPAYEGLTGPLQDFPKAATHCAQPDTAEQLCALDRRPYAPDFHESARNAGRGDNLARQVYSPDANPPGYRASPPPPNGVRGILAITDTASAARYGLQTAALRNAAGAFVAPTTSSMLAARAAAQGPVPQVDPRGTTRDAYPLTSVSYAVTAPALLTPQSGASYARLVRYAGSARAQDPGVAPGSLPDGYAPLPAADRTAALAAADRIEREAGVALATAAPEGVATGGEPASSDAGSGGVGGSAMGSATAGSGDLPAGTDAGAVPLVADAPAASTTQVALTSPGDGPGVPGGAARWALLVAAVTAALASCVRPLLAVLSAPRPAAASSGG